MSDKTVITCALNGVLTDPKQHPVPVTLEEMAREAKSAFNAGASVMHIHLRQQAPGNGSVQALPLISRCVHDRHSFKTTSDLSLRDDRRSVHRPSELTNAKRSVALPWPMPRMT